jgi:meso-butanediol dehydrogenase / (S,S)-butanediol dehydrogenase / diacetyl reductase
MAEAASTLRFQSMNQHPGAQAILPTKADTDNQPVAVVTGGARGIGLAVGRWFLQRGHRVALLDIDADTLRLAVDQLAGDDRMGNLATDRLLPLHVDVSDPKQVNAASNELMGRWGRVDALVNNAGVAVFKPALDTTFEEWRRVMGTNLDGVWLCSTVFGRHMVARRSGAIVNIGSISGLRASTLRVAYGTSKAALLHLTRQHAVEFGAAGVRVNAVSPGPVETEMAKQVHSPAIRADYHDAIPLGRYGTMEEIAEAVGFLCSAQAAYINGQCLAADGGFDAAGIGLPTFRRDGSNLTS